MNSPQQHSDRQDHSHSFCVEHGHLSDRDGSDPRRSLGPDQDHINHRDRVQHLASDPASLIKPARLLCVCTERSVYWMDLISRLKCSGTTHILHTLERERARESELLIKEQPVSGAMGGAKAACW